MFYFGAFGGEDLTRFYRFDQMTALTSLYQLMFSGFQPRVPGGSEDLCVATHESMDRLVLLVYHS